MSDIKGDNPPLTDEGQDDAPVDLGDRIVFTIQVIVTKKDFRDGGPPRVQDKIRDAAIAARDYFGPEIRKRRWTFDF